MEKFQNILAAFGAWADENKYLSVIKKAFQSFMPFIIMGAIGTLWTGVLVNQTNGLGAIWPPIMKLSFLNSAFSALNFCTQGIMALCITFFIGVEMAKVYKLDQKFCGFFSVAALISVTNTAKAFEGADGAISVSGIFSNELGASGLFTGMLVGILSIEMFRLFYKVDALKIKLPPQVPAGISRSFEYLIPGCIVLILTSLISLGVQKAIGGQYLNDLIFSVVQKPLMGLSTSLPGVLVFSLISSIFWSVGLHGDSMISGIVNPLMLALIAENAAAVDAGGAAPNIVNWAFYRVFRATGGTGMMIGLTIAILLIGKRQENRSIAKLTLVPNLFNINEICMFGIPIVLNPILIIPFILAPIVTMIFGYVTTAIGLCPVMYITLPWTMPPFLFGFLASGGNVMGGIIQLLAIMLAVLVYLPFVAIYEKQQNAADAAAAKIKTDAKT